MLYTYTTYIRKPKMTLSIFHFILNIFFYFTKSFYLAQTLKLGRALLEILFEIILQALKPPKV